MANISDNDRGPLRFAGFLEAEIDGDAAKRNQSFLYESSSQNPILSPEDDYGLTKELFSQQTACELQEAPPTPMTVRGEQVSAANTLRSLRTTPSKPRRAVIFGESA